MAAVTSVKLRWNHRVICLGLPKHSRHLGIGKFDTFEEDMIEKIIMISWMLWTNRNEVRNGGVKKSGKAVIHGALNYLGEY